MIRLSKFLLVNNGARYSVFLILCLTLGIEFYRLDARTFHGDELGSVFEAQQLGLNANSLPYFALLRLWVQLGVGEFWLRALSALVAVVLVAVTYAWTRMVGGVSVARLTALFLATSPFLISYAQQVRFYAVGLVAAGLAIWAFVKLLERSMTRKIVMWVIASAFAIAAMLMNGLLIAGQCMALFIITPHLSTRAKMILGLTASTIGIALIAVPAIRQFAFDALAIYTNSPVRYDASRGLALSQVAKIPLTFFFFIFGESVYPFALAFVIFGLVVFGFTAVVGLHRLWQDRHGFKFVAVTAIVAFSLLYLVFDPLVPPALQGAAPRYLIFLLPVFCWVIAMGAQGRTSWLVAPLLLVNFGSLASYWNGDWAYTDDRVNWREVSHWVSDFVTPETVLLLDGQSQPLADYYFPSEWKQTWFQPDQALESSRAIVFSYNWHPEARIQTTSYLRNLEKRYDPDAVWGQYPLFVYVYNRRLQPGANDVNAAGIVRIPNEIYGIEFQDLRLPFPVRIARRILNVTGTFGLPRLDGANAETIRLAEPVHARQVVLLSHLIGAGDVRDGTTVATLRVESADGQTQHIPLRAGYETNAWDKNCAMGNCRPIYRWHKRIALVGFQSYPDAWRDFDAFIFASELNLNSSLAIRTLEFERVPMPGKLYIWGIVLVP